jgi:hypothetical protein
MLRALKADGTKLFIVSVNSLMWPVSAALGVANLGLHTFEDPSIHQYIYPNIFVVTQYVYPFVSPSRVFVAPQRAFRERQFDGGAPFTDYKPEYVMDCFAAMISLWTA